MRQMDKAFFLNLNLRSILFKRSSLQLLYFWFFQIKKTFSVKIFRTKKPSNDVKRPYYYKIKSPKAQLYALPIYF